MLSLFFVSVLGKPTPALAANGKDHPPLAEMDDLYDVPYEDEIDEARSKLKTEPIRQVPSLREGQVT